jgi:hypothetical protein
MSFAQILLLTSWKDRALFAVSQAEMVNNLNDGMVWGLLPIFLVENGLSLEKVGIIAATPPRDGNALEVRLLKEKGGQ